MKRNHQLDFFRGLLLIIITIDHALIWNNVIRRFTCEFIGWVSAAEGFVFLSGLTAGIVYTHKANEKDSKFLSKLSLKRAFTIYRNHIALFAFICATVLLSPLIREHWGEAYAPLASQPLRSIITGSLLVYQPLYLDILPMYAIFILLVPICIRLFQKGYAQYVMLGSFMLYLLGSLNELFHFFTMPFQSYQLSSRSFALLGWQVLFFLGLSAGYLFYTGKTKRWQTNKPLLYIALGISITLFTFKNAHLDLSWINLDYAIDKTNVGPLRLINFIALCYLCIFISSKKDNWFNSKPVCYLGRYSLEVFSFHIVLLVTLLPIKMQFNSIYTLQLTDKFFFYPIDTLFVFLLILPLLFLAPTLFGKPKKASPALVLNHPVAQ